MIPVDPFRADANDRRPLVRRERVVQPVVGEHQIAKLKANVVAGIAPEIALARVVIIGDTHGQRVRRLREICVRRELILQSEERNVIFGIVDAILELRRRHIRKFGQRAAKGGDRRTETLRCDVAA